MGKLRVTDKGLKLYGDGEFMKSLYAQKIVSRPVSLQRLSTSTVESSHGHTLWYRLDERVFIGLGFFGSYELSYPEVSRGAQLSLQ